MKAFKCFQTLNSRSFQYVKRMLPLFRVGVKFEKYVRHIMTQSSPYKTNPEIIVAVSEKLNVEAKIISNGMIE